VSTCGNSSAGIIASLEARRNPSRYAGVILENAVLLRRSHRYKPQYEFFPVDAYQAYLHDTDPFMSLLHSKTPVFLINNADKDKDPFHASIAAIQNDFVDAAVRAQRAPQPVSVISPGMAWGETITREFTWLSAQRNHRGVMDTSPSWKYDGPIASVLADSFVVVEGTGGNEAQRLAIVNLSKRFQSAWEKTNFGACRVVLDTDLREEAEETMNMVLIGNEETNLVWKRLSPQLPITMQSDHIKIDTSQWDGKALSIQTWFRHPRFPNRKILLMGGSDLPNIDFGTFELDLDGWFSTAIWSHENGRVSLIDVRYNNN
jgi:hypothetical protein